MSKERGPAMSMSRSLKRQHEKVAMKDGPFVMRAPNRKRFPMHLNT